MAVSANNHTPDPRPTGDLEHLFRQKFADAEVAPRFQLWEQLDHELLVRQNEAYRRRLLLHRWVAAACVLFMLSLGGWAVLRPAHFSQMVAYTGGPASSHSATMAGERQGGLANPASTTPGAAREVAPALSSAFAEHLPESQAAKQAAYASVPASAKKEKDKLFLPQVFDNQLIIYKANSGSLQIYPVSASASAYADMQGNGAMLSARQVGALTDGLSAAFARPDTLKPALQAVPKPQAPAVAWENTPDEPASRSKTGRWRIGGGFGAASYNPNINFSGVSASSATAYTNSTSYSAKPNVYEASAAEYRRNLRPGPSQRVALTAAYALSKRWVLLTGLEATRQEATSKTSYSSAANNAALAGRSTYDYSAASQAVFANGQPRTTRYRYQTASLPVALRYGSPKTGVSFYAKVGAAVGVLLSSRTEVDDAPNLTRHDSFGSSDSPYRKVLASVRAGAGLHYRPADSTWSLALGPNAETGLNTLNANPTHPSRPYSLGMEASVEFGGTKAVVAR